MKPEGYVGYPEIYRSPFVYASWYSSGAYVPVHIKPSPVAMLITPLPIHCEPCCILRYIQILLSYTDLAGYIVLTPRGQRRAKSVRTEDRKS